MVYSQGKLGDFKTSPREILGFLKETFVHADDQGRYADSPGHGIITNDQYDAV